MSANCHTHHACQNCSVIRQGHVQPCCEARSRGGCGHHDDRNRQFFFWARETTSSHLSTAPTASNHRPPQYHSFHVFPLLQRVKRTILRPPCRAFVSRRCSNGHRRPSRIFNTTPLSTFSLLGAACRSLFTCASSIIPPPLLSLQCLHPITTAQMLGFFTSASGWESGRALMQCTESLPGHTALTQLSDVDSGDAPAEAECPSEDTCDT